MFTLSKCYRDSRDLVASKIAARSLLLFLILLTSCGERIELPPHLLVLGDSISLGYTPYLKQGLEGVMTVFHPDDNCRTSAYTLEHADEWLKDQDPTIITWNNGIWDCAISTESTETEYEANLRAIALRLKMTGARVYFVTTTDLPVHTDERGYIPGCEIIRNEIAKSVMRDFDIDVIDLNATALSIPEYHKSPDTKDDVHFLDAGYAILAAEILTYLQ